MVLITIFYFLVNGRLNWKVNFGVDLYMTRNRINMRKYKGTHDSEAINHILYERALRRRFWDNDGSHNLSCLWAITFILLSIFWSVETITASMLMIFAVMLCYLSSSDRSAWKIQAWTVLEPDLYDAVQCFISWAIGPTESWILCGSMISRKIVDICLLINEFSFELRMETISVLMTFAVLLCYVSCREKTH